MRVLSLKNRNTTSDYLIGLSSSSSSSLQLFSGSSFYFFFLLQKVSCLCGFEVLTAAVMKMAVSWVVTPCSLVEVYQRFRGPCCLYHRGDDDDGGSMEAARTSETLTMEAAKTSETLVNFYQTTRHYSPGHSHLPKVSLFSIKHHFVKTYKEVEV
jgi:hypothetical protein